MDENPFKRPHRVSERTGERLLVMSGLSWNLDSHNKSRDYNNVVAAVTLETALVESYRVDLLTACPGAHALRKVMQEYLLTIASPYHKTHPVSGALQSIEEWAFPDGIPLDVGTCGGRLYDAEELRKQMNELNLASATTTGSKGKGNTVLKTIEYLEKNPLLWCSDPKAKYGSVETLAHHCISTLSHVSQSFIIHMSPETPHALMFIDHEH
jgi:hypothetical protein